MKKIIAFFVAVFVFISFLAVCFSVSADNETGMTNQEYYAAQAYLVAKYKDGKISYSEFQQQSQAVTDEFVSKNTVGGVLQSGALNASNTFNAVSQKIGNTVQKYGESAREHIDSYISDFFDSYTVMSDKPTTDLNGSGALFEWYMPDGCIIKRAYCEYIIRDSSGSFRCYGDIREVCYNSNGSIESETFYPYSSNGCYVSWSSFPEYQKFYGDVRYTDGTQAPTDDEYETISDYDFSEAPERELEDLLKKILDEFELQQPDLSSIEGLLNAIYARLGTLDSDNDNALLASINSAILALVKSNNDNNEALLNELVGFREDLKNGTVGTGSAAHGHEISGTLYNVIPLDKNWLNKIFHNKENLKVRYEGKTYYLEDCGCLKLDKKYYTPNMNYDSYAISDYDFSNDDIEIDNSKYVDVDFKNYNTLLASFSKGQKKKVNDVIDLITKLVSQAVPYSAIKGAMIPFETIIFNSAEPQDIAFTFDPEVSDGFSSFIGYRVTFLSTSFLEKPYVRSALSIIKSFLTIVIGYSWLKSMRKKVVSMMG